MKNRSSDLDSNLKLPIALVIGVMKGGTTALQTIFLLIPRSALRSVKIYDFSMEKIKIRLWTDILKTLTGHLPGIKYGLNLHPHIPAIQKRKCQSSSTNISHMPGLFIFCVILSAASNPRL